MLNKFGELECGEIIAVHIYLAESENISEVIISMLEYIILYNPPDLVTSLLVLNMPALRILVGSDVDWPIFVQVTLTLILLLFKKGTWIIIVILQKSLRLFPMRR
jgi:hypothetical protein